MKTLQPRSALLPMLLLTASTIAGAGLTTLTNTASGETTPPLLAHVPTVIQGIVRTVQGTIVTLNVSSGADVTIRQVNVSRAVFENADGAQTSPQPLTVGESIVAVTRPLRAGTPLPSGSMDVGRPASPDILHVRVARSLDPSDVPMAIVIERNVLTPLQH